MISRKRDRIPKAGRPSRILAKNLIPGDKFCLSGDKVGVVTKVSVEVGRATGEIRAVAYEVRRSPRKRFDALVWGNKRVWIIETPISRRQRRANARITQSERPFVELVS